MRSFIKTGVAFLSFLLVTLAASSISYGQSGPFGGVIQMNSSSSYLGIQMDDVTPANMSKFKLTSEKGVIVRSVQTGTPAEKAGLREDDVILEYAGTPVWSASQFSRMVQETPPGRKVDLVVSRDGKRVNLAAEIGKRDDGRSGEDLRNFFRTYPEIPAPNRRDGNTLVIPAGRPRLGLTLQPLSDQLAEHMGVPGKKGALVSSVAEGSPSAGKIKAGDVIVAADGKEIREPEDLTQMVRNSAEGKMTLRLIRDKKEMTVELTLPSAPSNRDENGRGLRL